MRGRRNDGEDAEECVILASSLSSETSSSTSSLIAFSLPHFHLVRRFKSSAGTFQSPRSVDLCGTRHVFQICREKNALDVYDCPGGNRGVASVKDQKIKRFLFNEKPTSVCSSTCGSLVAVGFESGEVSMYERSTGKMRGKFTAHFKRVVKMQFTSDGSSLITCSEDTAVSAWSVCEALKCDTLNNNNASSSSFTSSSLEPMKSWTSHQLQVTDVCCSKSAGAGADLVASCSIDRTARVFSMTHGTGSECLATFGLPKALTAICMDGEDRCIFVGSCDGEIYEMNINGAPVVEMGGGGHLHDIERDDDDDDRGGEEEVKEEEDDKEKGNDNKKRRRMKKKKNESFTTYRGHDRAIVSLHCTSNGHHLLSTSEDGTCRLWDRASGKCIKTVKHPRGGDAPIASACLAIRSHVEKVIVNVGGSSNNNNAQEATITAGARYQKSSSNRQPPDVPLGTFERYGGSGSTKGGEGGSSNPWDGPLVLL